VTKHIGTAVRRKASVMLRRSCFAGLHLEVAKRIATAARKVVFDHSVAFVLCRAAEATKDLAGRQRRAEAGERRSS